MDLLKLFDTRRFTIAHRAGQKRRRRAAIRPCLVVETLEVRAMMDAQTDYDNAVAAAQAVFSTVQTTQDAAYQAAVDSAGATLESQAAPIASGLDIDTTNLTQDLNSTEDAATSQYNSDLNAADQAADPIEQSADDTMNAQVSQAQADLASQDASFEQQTGELVNQAEGSLSGEEAQHEAAFESTVATDQATHDANIADEQTTEIAANQADGSQLQTFEDGVNSQVSALDNTGAAVRDNVIANNASMVTNQSVAADPGFQAAYNSALATYNSESTAAGNTLNSAYAAAQQKEAASEQAYNDQMNNTISVDAAAFSRAQQQAQDGYNSALVPFQQQLDNTLASDQTQHDQQYQQAQNQFASDSQDASNGEASDEQAADAAYNQSAQPVIDAYNQFVTDRTNSYDQQAQGRLDQLNQELQQEQTDFANTTAPYAAQDQSQDAAAVASYNAGVQALQQTQNSNDQAAWSTFNGTVGPADQTLSDAENTYQQTVMSIYNQAMQDGTQPDQSALDGAWNTLLAAKHQHANTVAQANQALVLAIGADAVQFWTQEEPLYVTEQDGLAMNDGNYITNVAAAYRLLQDQQEASQTGYATDIANDEASMDNDILAQYGSEQKTLRGYEDTRDKAYDLAEKNYCDKMTAAYNSEWATEIAAEQQQGDNDSVAYGAFFKQVLGPWQTEENQIAAAMAKQVHDDAAAKTLNSQQVAAAMAQELNDEEAANVAFDTAIGAASQDFLNQVAPAWVATASALTNADLGSIAVAQAWMSYFQTVVSNGNQGQSQDDAEEEATLSDELQNWQDYINFGASQDETLANEVAAAVVQQVSDDCNSVVNYLGQINMDEITLAFQEIAAAAGEATKEAAAYVQDSLQYAIAELARANGYVTAATTWIGKVIPEAVADQESLNNDAAGVVAALEPDILAAVKTVDQAQQTETENLVGPAKTEIHSIAEARKTFVIAQAQQQASDANQAASQNVAAVAAEPDSDFAGEEPGASDGMSPPVSPSTPPGPAMQALVDPFKLSKAEQIAMDRSPSCQEALSAAEGILKASNPELTKLIAAAWNAANTLSVTTRWNTYPFGSGRPHCADYAGAMVTAMAQVQRSKFNIENVDFARLGDHGAMITDKATGKQVYLYVSPASFLSYNQGLDGWVFGPTLHTVDGALFQRLNDNPPTYKITDDPFWFGG